MIRVHNYSLLLIFILSLPAFSSSITVSGLVAGNWQADTVLVVGDLNIASGNTLTIESGTEVIFQGHYNLKVQGFIIALGMENDSIIFTAQNQVTGWKGIRFLNAPDSSHLEYCIFEYGRAIGVYPDSSGFGGGIYCYNSSPVIRNSTFRYNYCEWYGGAMCFHTNSNALIEDCVFIGNISDDDAGAIFCHTNSEPVIRQCLMTENWAIAWGGAICSFWSNPIVEYCILTNNWADDGGGYFAAYSEGGMVDHCIIANNSANWAGGIYNHTNSAAVFTNCTVYGNNASTAGGGIYISAASTTQIVNTIISQNTGSGGINFTNSPNTSLSYSDVYSNLPVNFSGNTIPAQLGQISTVNANGDPCDRFFNLLLNPNFVNPLQSNFQLQGNSPCIDAGNPASPFDPDSTISDIGAIYYQPTGGTAVPGGNVGGNWTIDGSPYLIEGGITIPVSGSLNIGAGVEVIFQGHYRLNVEGTLTASGTEADSILFTASDTMTGWDGIHIVDAPAGSSLSYCVLLYGKAPGLSPNAESCGGAIYLENSSFSFTNCRFSHNTAGVSGGGIYIFQCSPIIANCDFTANSAGNLGGGIYAGYGNPSITGCNISGNVSGFGGGGIHICGTAYPVITDCIMENNSSSTGGGIYFQWSGGTLSYSTIKGNTADNGAGLACAYTLSDLNLHHNIIFDNTAEDCGGGIWSYHYQNYPHGTIDKNTITENSAVFGGGIYCAPYSGLTIVNNILADNSGTGGIYVAANTTDNITYSNFYNNPGGNFAGPGLPASLGTLSAVNANGDSCDTYHNIQFDPLFVNSAGNDYHLTELSPCIDAGNPAPAYIDPDGTIADMGAFYYNLFAAIASLAMIPENPPIVIPPAGGSFNYTITVENLSDDSLRIDFWTMATASSGLQYGPQVLIDNKVLAPGTVITRQINQLVGAAVGAGAYIFNGYIGQYPNSVWSQDQFTITKLSSFGNNFAESTVEGWGTYYEDADMLAEIASAADVAPEAFTLTPPYPNPFNQSLTLEFSLPEAAEIHLAVYDITGREAAALGIGHWASGKHSVVWDAEGVGSGVYFARLMVDGRWSMARKVALLK